MNVVCLGKKRTRNIESQIPSFRWIIPNVLAASAMPLSAEQVKKAGIGIVVSLLLDSEVSDLPQDFQVEGRRRQVLKSGITVHSIPIEGKKAPNQRQFLRFLSVMDSAKGQRKPKKVLVYCRGGIGRTGTIAAGYLITRHGFFLEQAYAAIKTGLARSYIDRLAHDPRTVADAKAEGVSLIQFIKRSSPFRFPESPAQGKFLAAVEANYRPKAAEIAARARRKKRRNQGVPW